MGACRKTRSKEFEYMHDGTTVGFGIPTYSGFAGLWHQQVQKYGDISTP